MTATAELDGTAVDQCAVDEGRFTLLAPDAYRENYLEIALWDAARQPARARVALRGRRRGRGRVGPVAVAVAVAVVGDAVDQAELARLLGGEVAVALEGVGDLLRGAPGVLDVDLLDAAAQLERLAGVDLDVGRLALVAAAGLVDEDARSSGSAKRLPGVPPASNSEPIDIAIPQQVVATSGLMKRIVS